MRDWEAPSSYDNTHIMTLSSLYGNLNIENGRSWFNALEVFHCGPNSDEQLQRDINIADFRRTPTSFLRHGQFSMSGDLRR